MIRLCSMPPGRACPAGVVAVLGEQPADVVLVQAAAEHVALVDDAGEQLALALLERHHLLLDRVPGDEPVHDHIAGPESCRPVDALPGLKAGDSARAALHGTPEASRFTGRRRRKRRSYLASTGV